MCIRDRYKSVFEVLEAEITRAGTGRDPDTPLQSIEQELAGIERAYSGVGEEAPEAMTPMAASRWYTRKIAQLFPGMSSRPFAPLEIIREEQSRLRGRFTWGVMNMFFYKPQGAAKLEYYDLFPLVIPFRKYTNGFVGINLHYLPFDLRIRLLSKTMVQMGQTTGQADIEEAAGEGVVGARGDKVLLQWQRIKHNETVIPIVRRYRAKNVMSKFMVIEPSEFIIAAMLPTARFRKGPLDESSIVQTKEVYRQTRIKIREAFKTA